MISGKEDDDDDVICSVSVKANSDRNGSSNLTTEEDDIIFSGKTKNLPLANFQNGKLNSLTHNDAAAYYFPKVSYIPPGNVLVSKTCAKLFKPFTGRRSPISAYYRTCIKIVAILSKGSGQSWPSGMLQLGCSKGVSENL